MTIIHETQKLSYSEFNFFDLDRIHCIFFPCHKIQDHVIFPFPSIWTYVCHGILSSWFSCRWQFEINLLEKESSNSGPICVVGKWLCGQRCPAGQWVLNSSFPLLAKRVPLSLSAIYLSLSTLIRMLYAPWWILSDWYSSFNTVNVT